MHPWLSSASIYVFLQQTPSCFSEAGLFQELRVSACGILSRPVKSSSLPPLSSLALLHSCFRETSPLKTPLLGAMSCWFFPVPSFLLCPPSLCGSPPLFWALFLVVRMVLDISSCPRVCPGAGLGPGPGCRCVGGTPGRAQEPGVRKAAMSLYIWGALGLQLHAGG